MGKKWCAIWEGDIPEFFDPDKSLPHYLGAGTLVALDFLSKRGESPKAFIVLKSAYK